jgi:imidazolonepropionase
MYLLKNFNQIITLKSAHQKDGRSLLPVDLSIINDAAIIFDNEIIHWVGPTKDIPSDFKISQEKDMKGHILTPEVVDSHTHLVFGGNRSTEYSMRLNGADYQAIANAGGGILNTMKATNETSKDELIQLAKERIDRIHSYGVGTIEIKSGYALNYEKEKELTLIINELKKEYAGQIQIFNTFLAAHAVPQGFTSKKYLEEVVIPLMTELKDSIDAVDIFHEEGYFSTEDSKLLFEKAKSLNLNIKSHADEFNDNKGAILACDYAALSCDHLLCTGDDGVEALSKGSTVATLLPGTALFLGKPLANARKFLDAGCKVALASDYNPGSCHCDNLILLASLAAKNLEMNIAEVWSAICLNSAHALGLLKQGALKEGFKPRFTFFKCNSIDEITYSWGRNFSVTSPIGRR